MAHKPKPPYTKKDSIEAATGDEKAMKKRQARRDWVNEHRKTSKKRDVKRVTNEDASGRNLEQYILNQNLDQISRYFLSNKQLFNYQTFRQINGDGMQIVNKLRGIDNLNVFYKIKQRALSLMQPKIRLYKVYYDQWKRNPDGSIDQSVKSTPYRTPCYKEIKFSDNFGKETAATVSDYLSYETTKPTFRNVGLKSFSWNWNGQNFGIIENNIECSLQLVFKSLKDIKASVPGHPDVIYVDLFLWPGSRFKKDTEFVDPKHYEIKALVGYTAPRPDQLNNLNLTQEDVRNIANVEKLNTVISLSMVDYKIDIKEDGQVRVNISYRGRIETVIGTNQVNIFQSTFRINRSGAAETSYTVDSETSFNKVVKMLDKILAMFNELGEPKCINDKCKSRQEFIKLLKTDKLFREAWTASGGKHVKTTGGKIQIKKDDHDKIFEYFLSKVKIKGKKAKEYVADRMRAVLRQKLGLYKKQTYQSFVEQLIDGNDSDLPTTPGTRLFCFNASRKSVEGAVGADAAFDAVGVGRDPSDEFNEEAATQFGSDKVGRCHEMRPPTAKFKASVAAEFNDYERHTQDKAKSKKKGAKKKDASKKSTFNFDGDNYPFYFIFLGDLIELACKNGGLSKLGLGDPKDIPVFRPESYTDEKKAGEGYALHRARILLGPVEYLDAKGQIQTINLSQFPISFNYFRAWFFQKIIRRRAVQMPLGSFLGLLISELVIPAMGLGQKKTIKAGRTHSSVIALSLPGQQTSGLVKTKCGEDMGMKELLPLKRVINVDSAEFRQNYFSKASKPMSSESLLKTSFDYILLSVSTIKDMKKRKGNPAQDIKDGIYHFNIGSDMGLMKKMTFKKAGLSFLAEMRSELAEEKGEDQLSQLRFPHDTYITLIGCSLFSPGMFVYVNPGLAGIGSPEDANSLASELNIGGYQWVGEVKSSITQGKFETILVATQTV